MIRAAAATTGNTSLIPADIELSLPHRLSSAHREVEIDAAYSAYDEHPIDEADDWGDVASHNPRHPE